MGFTFHLQHHSDPVTERKLDWIIRALDTIIKRIDKLEQELARAETAAANIESKVDSAVSVLTTVAQLIRDNIGNTARLTALANGLDAKAAALGAAIDATPADPVPAPAA